MSDGSGKSELPTGRYEVGYGKPPRQTQFRKGQSGNPTGRPRKGSSMQEIIEAELRRPIIMKENGRKRKIDARRALVISLRNRAFQNDPKALAQIIKYAEAFDAKAEARRPKIPPDASPRILNRMRHLTTLFEGLHEFGIIKIDQNKALLDLSVLLVDNDETAASLRILNERLSLYDDPSW